MRASQAVFTRQIQTDLRQVLTSSELLAYWDLRPYVSGAQASLTLSATLASFGSTPPIVLMTGSLSPPRQVKISYASVVANVVSYRIDCGDGWNASTGFSGTFNQTAGATVSIGSGNSIVFPIGTYNTDNSHWAKAASWGELTGRANSTLTDTLSVGLGHRYEAYGMGGVLPSLYMWNSYMANSLAIPALVSGTDIAFEMWMLYETWTLTDAAKAFAIWCFSHTLVANNGKNVIDLITTGPSNAVAALAWIIQRLDGGGAPAFARFISTYKPDLSPKVVRAVVSANGQLYVNGLPTRPAGNQSLNRGAITSVDQFILGAAPLGTTAPTNTFAQGRITALALCNPLAAGRDLVCGKALAGRIP